MARILLLLVAGLLFAPLASATDAESLLRQGRVVEALDRAAQAVAARPDDVATQELAVDVFLTLGEVDRAVAHAKSRVAAAPLSADSHYLLGRAELDPARSRSAYERALELDPEHARSHMGIGSLEEAAGQLDAAQEAYLRAVQGDPTLVEAWTGLSRAHLSQGNRGEARKAAIEGFERTRSSDLALVLATLDPKHARSVLSEALDASGPSLALHVALARTGLLEGDAAFAREQSQKALLLDPSAFDARVVFHFARELTAGRIRKAPLSTALSTSPGSPRARQALDQAVAAAPKSAMVRHARALSRQAGRDAGFLDDLVAATALDPDNDLVATAAGIGLLGAGRPSEAVGPLTRALSVRPWDRDLSLGLAQALRGAGHVGDAVLLLERVASAHPRHPESQLLYAQTLIDAGRHEEAYAVTRIAMQTTGDPRLVAAFVRVAPLVGRPGEAATVLAPIAERSGSAELEAAVERLRAMATP